MLFLSLMFWWSCCSDAANASQVLISLMLPNCFLSITIKDLKLFDASWYWNVILLVFWSILINCSRIVIGRCYLALLSVWMIPPTLCRFIQFLVWCIFFSFSLSFGLLFGSSFFHVLRVWSSRCTLCWKLIKLCCL